MQPFSFLTDHSSQAPRLRCGQSLWGMEKLPYNAPIEWSLEEKVARIKEVGFEHIECWATDDAEGNRVVNTIRDSGLALALGHRPMSVTDTLSAVERAAKWGVQWLLCQPATAYTPLSEVAEIVRTGAKAAAEAGVCYFVETHRNNYTETIRQTLELIEAVPEIAITADFSHFVVVGEFYGWSSEGAIERMRPIIERVAHVHGRISNGEQVQVDVGNGSGSEGTPAGFFRAIWAEIFKSWRARAQVGDIMPFSSELGPPRYAITTYEGKEISDRWSQALVMRQLAESAWNDSTPKTGG